MNFKCILTRKKVKKYRYFLPPLVYFFLRNFADLNMLRTGLFFGSFNPVHHGHLMIAGYVAETCGLDQVWFVVSPHNPLKNKDSLLPERDRKHLIDLCIEKDPRLRTSDIEFSLPQPSYTIDTLTHLKEKYPEREFSLIMGSDNLASLHKWKNHEQLLKHYPIWVYARRGFTANPYPAHPGVHWLDFPLLDISATFIRENIRKGVSMQYFMPEPAWQYVCDFHLYKKGKTSG